MMTNDVRDSYALWRARALEDADLTEELARVEGNDEEIYERFYRELEFGQRPACAA